MKKNKGLSLLIIVVSLILNIGCSDDIEISERQEESYDLKTAYLPIRLTTRAGEQTFDFGKEDGSEIELSPATNHYAIFFKDNGLFPIAVSKLFNIYHSSSGENNANTTGAIAAVVYKSEDKNFFNNLDECLIILNSTLTETDLETSSKNTILNKVVKTASIKHEGKEYLTMTNAVYIDAFNNKIYSAPVKHGDEYIFDTQEKASQEAWKKDGKVAIEAIVERLSAKFQLEDASDEYIHYINVFDHIDIEKGITIYDNEKYSCKAELTGWGMNGIEKEIYLFKNVSLNGNYFDDWNDPENFRCYWGEVPTYSSTSYPFQYRRAVDAQINNYSELEKINGNLLQNYSYNYFVSSDNFGKTIYSPESTYDFKLKTLHSLFEKRLPTLAGTHLIVTGRILTDINGDGYQPNNIYRDRIGNYYRTELDCFKALALELNNEFHSQTIMKFNAHNWSEGASFRNEPLEALTQGGCYLYLGDTKLTPEELNKLTANSEEYIYTEQANIKDGDGKRIIWNPDLTIKDIKGNTLQIITKITYDQYGVPHYDTRNATIDEIRSLIVEWTGTIDHFYNGMMYYGVPVYFNEDEEIYGVVRNHSYKFIIDAITKIGTPIDNADEEIVPNEVPVKDQIKVSVDIIKWHEMQSNAPFL